MAEIPRKQVLPQRMIQKVIEKIQRDVEQQIIPIQTGMYTIEKLQERLRAIPNLELVSYDDPIFYDIHDKTKELSMASSSKQLKDLPPSKCPNCDKITSSKFKLYRCGFCAVWRCEDCLCERKRPHPRSKNIGIQNNEARYSICYPCDKKFLLLMLNHNFSENKRLFQEAILILKKQCDKIETQGQNIKQKEYKLFIQPAVRNTSKLQKLKKEGTELKKEIQLKSKQLESEKSKFIDQAKIYQSLQEKKRQIQLKKQQNMKQLLNQKQRRKRIKEEKQKQQRLEKQQKQRLKQQILRKKQEQLQQQRQRIAKLQQQRQQALRQLQQQKVYRQSMQENLPIQVHLQANQQYQQGEKQIEHEHEHKHEHEHEHENQHEQPSHSLSNQPSNESFILNHFRQQSTEEQLRSSFQNRQLQEYYYQGSSSGSPQKNTQHNQYGNQGYTEPSQMTFQPSRIPQDYSDEQQYYSQVKSKTPTKNMSKQKDGNPSYFENQQQQEPQLSFEQLQRKRDQQTQELQKQFREKKLSEVRQSLKQKSPYQTKQVHEVVVKQILVTNKQKIKWDTQEENANQKMDPSPKCMCQIF